MYKLAVFDLDGTLVDSIGDIANAANYALINMGLATYNELEYREFIGEGLEVLCERALRKNSMLGAVTSNVMAENIAAMVELYRDYYLQHKSDLTAPFADISDVISKLKAAGVTLAVATNKSEDLAETIIERTYGGNLFEYIFGATPERILKPSPDIIHDLLDVTGFGKDETIMIGDSDVDLLTARNAEISSVYVAWGYGKDTPEEKFTHYVDNAEQLLKIIL